MNILEFNFKLLFNTIIFNKWCCFSYFINIYYWNNIFCNLHRAHDPLDDGAGRRKLGYFQSLEYQPVSDDNDWKHLDDCHRVPADC